MRHVRSMRPRIFSFTVALLLALASGYALPMAQPASKRPLTIDDYTKWRSITGQAISGDGTWMTYTLQLTNTIPAEAKPVLHMKNLETDEDVTVPDATGGTFSPDSKWIAYQVDPGAAQRARAARASAGSAQSGTPPGGATTPPGEPPATPPGTPSTPTTPPVTPPTVPPPPPTPPVTPPATPPGTPLPAPPTTAQTGPQPGPQTGRGAASTIPPRRVELRNLATGAVQSWQEIGTFTFSPASTHLFLQRRRPETGAEGGGRGTGPGGPGGGASGGGRGGAAAAPSGPRGLDVVLVNLRTGRHQLLGSVGDIAFNRTGTLLAYTVDATIKDGNGLFVFDARSGRAATLDNDAKHYNRLAWNEDGTALAVVKGLDVEKKREKENVLLAFPDVPGVFDEEGDNGDATPVVLDPAKTEHFPKGWLVSDRAPLGWSEDNERVFFGIKEQLPAPDTTRKNTDESPDVDVWNSADERIQSAQMVRADADRNVTFRQAFDVTSKRFVKLAD